ncbi:MAG: secretin and TonB N-terminal domain-containing protein [Smithella sp.]|jgi:type IV pilus assembly protein PilQ
MKKHLSKIFIALIIISWIFVYITENSFAAVADDKSSASVATAQSGTLENVLLAKLPGKERVHLVVSKQPLIDVKNKINGSYLIKLEDMVMPDNLCRPLGEGELNNIISVVPSRQLIDGKNWVYLNVFINKVVPYSIRQEGQNILIDFNVSGLELKKAGDLKNAGPKKVVVEVREGTEKANAFTKDEAFDLPLRKEPAKKQTERIISLDFQDADIKSVLRLMAEYGNVSIVSGDDVKGNITLSMKNVPWTKALDTILDVNSLTKREGDNVIIVTTVKKQKEDDADKIKAMDDENARKTKERNLMAEKGLLKQILIEAKIVEATEDFARDIGVQWGFGNNQKVSNGTYGLGVTGGSSSSTSSTYSQSYPSQIGIVNSSTGDALAMAAVNFPSAVASPAIGLVFGGATGFLEAQLAALEENTTGKVISAPKVVTMEGIKATIKQGEEVPYVTTDKEGNTNVSFKDALLKLEVTPRITPEGKISMDITASNDYADWTKTNDNNENPPIVKNEVISKLVINDGDTIVIGGILKSQESKTVSGWPWLQKIPVLGFLFKTESLSKEKRQLLIFVTPKILKSDYVGERPENFLNK